MTENDYLSIVNKHVPNVKIKDKSSSKFLSVLQKIFPYMKSAWTTIGYTIYRPDGGASVMILHEGVHCVQKERDGWKYEMKYLFPQCFSILALLTFFNWWWLLSLLFLLPWPAPWRMLYELEAYKVQVSVDTLMWGRDFGKALAHVLSEYFVNHKYYFMWPFRKYINRKLEKHVINTYFLTDSVWNNSYIRDIVLKLDREDYIHHDGVNWNMLDVRYNDR